MEMLIKHSGIEWIGEIPAEWKIQRFKSVIHSMKKGNGITKEDVVANGEVQCVRYGEIYSKYSGSFAKCVSTTNLANVSSPQFFSYGDILFACTGELTEEIGKNVVYVGSEECLAGGDIIIAKHSQNPVFLNYAMNSAYAQAQKSRDKTKLKVVHISASEIGNVRIALPPIYEQTKVASFLDGECARIDSIIEQTRASIEEYKKLKQALITEAVTKGVRPGRVMKDSGVEWIGEIPADWSMERGKKLFVEINARSSDGSEELLTVSQYTGITPRSQKNVNMFEAETLEGYKICEIGDIAANTMWMWAGAIGVSQYRGVISPSYNIYRQKNNDYYSNYLDYLLSAKPLVEHYESLSTGIRASRLRLYPQQFLSIRFPLPPVGEQREIAEYLHGKIIEINKLIDNKNSLISELEEYKKTIIYEYVTGKKRVDS